MKYSFFCLIRFWVRFFRIIVSFGDSAAHFSPQAISHHFGRFKTDAAQARVQHLRIELLLHNFEHHGDLLVSKLDLLSELLNCLALVKTRFVRRNHVSEALDFLLVLGGFDASGQVIDGLLRLLHVLLEVVLLAPALLQGDVADILLSTHVVRPTERLVLLELLANGCLESRFLLQLTFLFAAIAEALLRGADVAAHAESCT